MLEAFLVAKNAHVDFYRPPNNLKDFNVWFFDYGPYYGIGFMSKTASGLGGGDPKRPSGITYLIDKKTLKFAVADG